MWKQGVLILVTVLMITSLFVGCSPKNEVANSNTNNQGGDTNNQKYAGVTLTVAAAQGWIKDVDKELAQKFKEETGISIDFQINPDDQYDTVVKTKLSSGQGPDIFYTPVGSQLKMYMPDKYMADLSDEPWVKDYKDWAKTATTYNGKIVGLNTWGRDGWGMLYDSEIFKKYNLEVPQNYEEFLTVCDTLKANGIIPIWEPGKADWHTQQWLVEAGYSVEKKLPGTFAKLNDNKIKFADIEEFETILGRYKELADRGYFQEDFLSADWNVAEQEMASGKYAMVMVWSAEGKTIVEKFSDAGPVDKWLMFPVPIVENMKVWCMSSGGISRSINKDTKNMEAVKAYFNFLTKQENLEAYYEARSDLQETSFTTVNATATAAFNSVTEYATEGIGDELSAAVQYLNGGIIGKAMQEMLLGGKSPKEVLEAIDNDRDKMFKALE